MADLLSLDESLKQHALTWLRGLETPRWARTCQSLAFLAKDRRLWAAFMRQEFPDAHTNAAVFGPPDQLLPGDFSSVSSTLACYQWNFKTSQCRAICWHQVPCHHHLGAREGSPGMFATRGYVFVYGGWGYGPMDDLHVAPLRRPLTFRRVPIAGDGIPASYEMKVTLLEEARGEEAAEGQESRPVMVAVTGGWMVGGYHHESPACGLMEITFPERSLLPEGPGQAVPLPSARWAHVLRMTPRSNHSATFVPPHLAGPLYTKGYLLIFGGNVTSQVSNSVDVLDLATLSWECSKPTTGSPPAPRNSHSAMVLRTPRGMRVVIAGGGTGDVSNGGPPRGGRDVKDVYCLDPERFAWECVRGGFARGRGHYAFSMGNTLVAFSGGIIPQTEMTKIAAPEGSEALAATAHVCSAGSATPGARAFGGSCVLPDGTLVLYGGWHPGRGTYRDFWIGHVAGCKTKYCTLLCDAADSCVEGKARHSQGRSRSIPDKLFDMVRALLPCPVVVVFLAATSWNTLARCVAYVCRFFV